MKDRLAKIEFDYRDLDVRLSGVEYALEDSIIQCIGALALHLARQGHIDLEAFERDLRDDFDPSLTNEDSTGVLFSRFAELVAFYRREGLQVIGMKPSAKTKVLVS